MRSDAVLQARALALCRDSAAGERQVFPDPARTAREGSDQSSVSSLAARHRP